MHDSRAQKRWLRLVLTATTLAVTAVAVGYSHHPAFASEAVSDVAPVVAEPRSVGWVGDSIGWQAHYDIELQVSQTHRLSTFNSIIGATIQDQLPAAQDAVIGPDSPDILLVELGHNDAGKVDAAQFADHIRRFLDGVTPHVECVRWLDVKRGGSPYYDRFNENAALYNAVLADVVDEYPTVRVLSYSTWADLNGPAAFDIDGVHLSRRGERGLGQLASRAVELCESDIEVGSEPLGTPADRA